MPGVNRIRQGAASDPIVLDDTDDGHDATVSSPSMSPLDSKSTDIIKREDTVRVPSLPLD